MISCILSTLYFLIYIMWIIKHHQQVLKRLTQITYINVLYNEQIVLQILCHFIFILPPPPPLSLFTECYHSIPFSTSSLPLLCPLLCILIFSLWIHYVPLGSSFLKWRMIMVVMVMMTTTTAAKNITLCGVSPG